MKIVSFKNLALLGLALSPLANAVTTDPVGVVKITIDAAAAADQPTYSYLSTSMSAEMAYQGTVTDADTGTITIGSDDWTVDQFNSVPYYAIVASGTYEGEILDIASNTVNTLTLSGGPATEDQSGLIGETIRIHKHNTIASIFGSDPATNTVNKGNLLTADQIQLHDPINGYTTYFWNNETDPFDPSIITGWISTKNANVSADDTVIYPDDGFVYKRVSTTSFEVNVSGTVITNSIQVPIINGYNLVCVPYPVDPATKNITLGSSNLYPEDENDFDINIHLKPGGLLDADRVIIRENGTVKTYYYNNVLDPFDPSIITGWISTSDPSTSAADKVIPSGGIFILRKTGSPAFHWSFPSVTN